MRVTRSSLCSLGIANTMVTLSDYLVRAACAPCCAAAGEIRKLDQSYGKSRLTFEERRHILLGPPNSWTFAFVAEGLSNT